MLGALRSNTTYNLSDLPPASSLSACGLSRFLAKLICGPPKLVRESKRGK
jgi:hypothetical protein